MFCGLVRDWASSESVARGRGGLKASDRKLQETKRQVQAIERLKGLYREKTAELPGTRLAFWRGAGTRMEVVLPVCRKNNELRRESLKMSDKPVRTKYLHWVRDFKTKLSHDHRIIMCAIVQLLALPWSRVSEQRPQLLLAILAGVQLPG